MHEDDLSALEHSEGAYSSDMVCSNTPDGEVGHVMWMMMMMYTYQTSPVACHRDWVQLTLSGHGMQR